MALQAVYRRYDTILKPGQHAAKLSNERSISHLSKTYYYRTRSDFIFQKNCYFATKMIIQCLKNLVNS